jgi:Ca-activated chloride channel homolog
MSFGQPYLLLLLLGLPLLAWLKGRRHHPPAFVYSSVQLVRGITGVRRAHAGVMLVRLRWLTLALFIVALAQPRVGEGETRITASGVDIVVALDRSSSMSAEDFELEAGRPVDRLTIAKDVLRRFIEKRPNDRIGLIVFALNAYMASPLTLDHDFLRQNLERLEIATREEDGTAIGSALASALNRLREVPSVSKIVILMTDGQNNAGKVPPLTAAEAAEALGVKVYTIGVGTRGVARVPYLDQWGVRRYVQQQVNIDEEMLTEIALRTGGQYYRADRTETLFAIYDEIDQLEKTEVEVRHHERYLELFPWFVLPGVVLLLLEIILSNTVWRRLP